MLFLEQPYFWRLAEFAKLIFPALLDVISRVYSVGQSDKFKLW